MRRLLRRRLVMALLGLLGACAPARAQNALLAPGARLPRFALPDFSGQSFFSATLANRPVVLVFVAISETTMGPPLTELLDLQERFKDRRLACVVIWYAPQTMRGQRLVPSVRTPLNVRLALPLLVDRDLVAGQFGVRRDNALFLVDDVGIIRGNASFVGAQPGLVEIKTRIWLGNGEPPEKLGWRGDLVETWTRVVDGRTGRGFPLPKPGPREVARELRAFARPVLRVWMSVEGESDAVVTSLRAIVSEAMADWREALPTVALEFCEQRADADAVLQFRPQVLDPRDARGLRTLCCYFRTLTEAEPLESPRAQRVTTLLQIAGAHAAGQTPHARAALKKLVTAALGFALGLAQRDDPESVMTPEADDAAPVTRPSADDILLVRHLWANVALRAGRALVETQTLQEARDLLPLIPEGMPQQKLLSSIVRERR